MLSDEQQTSGSDRRQYHAVRAIFDEALELIRPFFDPANSWGNRSMTHFAYRTLHEHYPQLSTVEVQVLVNAAERYFSGERKHIHPSS